jgi:hypothetical protein
MPGTYQRYIGKSDPHIVMVSTPNAPEGLFERIEKEPGQSCLYKRIFLDYTYDVNRIYSKDEIATFLLVVLATASCLPLLLVVPFYMQVVRYDISNRH